MQLVLDWLRHGVGGLGILERRVELNGGLVGRGAGERLPFLDYLLELLLVIHL
jgi:hypothetical protein